mmetsp:Transcript_6666/g.14571  ORF Transcript_6666/g.14571 Transcript_6666/m.14571 type:complete len:196 (-) Transcript_6666:652-1239(-)
MKGKSIDKAWELNNSATTAPRLSWHEKCCPIKQQQPAAVAPVVLPGCALEDYANEPTALRWIPERALVSCTILPQCTVAAMQLTGSSASAENPRRNFYASLDQLLIRFWIFWHDSPASPKATASSSSRLAQTGPAEERYTLWGTQDAPPLHDSSERESAQTYLVLAALFWASAAAGRGAACPQGLPEPHGALPAV